MIFYDNRASVNPYVNLAIEEYFFKEETEDVLILWQSENAIIVGKHQNTLAEINLAYALQHNIDIVRRLSGGGTVFHDLGNLNFTFIQTGHKERLVDFDKFLKPIIEGLTSMGVKAYQGKRNEIMVEGLKISGNAEHTFKDRVLHHGTLLFNSDLSRLRKSLRVNPLKFQDKAIKSVQSRVGNIQDFIPEIHFDQFRSNLANFLIQHLKATTLETLPDHVNTYVKNLVDEKYETWDWNFGYSPSYVLKKEIDLLNETFQLNLEVKKGKIKLLEFTPQPSLQIQEILLDLIGETHNLEEFKAIFSSNNNINPLDFF